MTNIIAVENVMRAARKSYENARSPIPPITAPIFTKRIDPQLEARRPGSKDSIAPPGTVTAIHHVRDP